MVRERTHKTSKHRSLALATWMILPALMLAPRALSAQAVTQDSEQLSPDLPAEKETVRPSPNLNLGRTLYAQKCATCHGAKGRGDGATARHLVPRPTDLTNGQYKIRSTPEGSLPTDDDLFRTITYGVPGTSMPSWMGLSAADRWQLVYYLKSLIANFDQRQGKPISIPETWPVTVEMVDRGRAIYTTLQCSQCHGSDGRGDGPASDGLRDYRGDRAYPFDFGRAYKFKGGDSPRDLYRTLHTGLNGTPMKSFNGMLTERDTWSLVHFVRSLRVDGPRPNIVAEKDDGTSIGNARSLRVSIEKLQSQVEQTRAEAAKAQSDASAAKAILKQLLSKEAAEDRAAAEQAGREQASKDKAARDKAARARAAREQAAERRALAKEVRVIYRKRCAACHGPRGRGDGPAAPGLQPKPRNFSDPAWQKSVSNRTIERAIAQGGPAVGKSPVMPKSADLAKRPEVITQLRKLLRGFAR